jgi:transposase
LVKLRDKRVSKSTPQQMQAALVGDYRAEHLFVLSQSLQAYRFDQARIEECDRQTEPLLEKLAQQVEAASAQLKPLQGAQPEEALSVPRNEPKTGTSASSPPNKAKRKHKPVANEPRIELAGLLERICGIDLTQVVGLNVLSALLIVSEIGIDMSKWRSAKAFCSWLGLCPGNKISGGKVLDSRTRQVANRVADALRLAAQSVGRTETCLGIFFRRKQAHLGAPKATTATARKLACLIYHLLKYKQPYQKLDPAIYQLRLQKFALLRLQNQATTLGYKLVPTASVPV